MSWNGDLLRRTAVLAALAGALLCALAASASAQMASALGKPLPVSDLEAGTVQVRVINGAPDKPLIGIDVTLEGEGGATRTARTDAEGRATFPKLEAGTQWVAKVRVEKDDGTADEGASEALEIPSSGGLRVMISPVPWAAPAAGPAAGGMPDPRQMSGIPRPQRGDPPGQLTVRVVHGTMANSIPGETVYLVSYAADGTVGVETAVTDAGGRATFSNLSLSGFKAYYAMIVTRDGRDRVRSQPITAFPEAGLRLVLAGHEPGATEPVEDLAQVEEQGAGVPAGQVVVRIRGMVADGEVELIEVGSGEVRTAPITGSLPIGEGAVTGQLSPPTATDALSPGTLSVALMRDTQRGVTPVPGQTVRVVRAGAATPADEVVLGEARSAPNGLATVTGLTVGEQVILVVDAFGTELRSAPFAIGAESGLRVTGTLRWQGVTAAEARFDDVDDAPDKIYYARLAGGELSNVSAPFQMVPGRGAAVGVLAIPRRLVFNFHLVGEQDDKYFGFTGQLGIQNWSFMPYDPGRDGLLIPLPKGFVGAGVAPEWESRVTVDQGEGLIWRGPLPPGGVDVRAGFSLIVDDGAITYDMPLPLGTFQSSLILIYSAGMQFKLPDGVQGRLGERGGTKFYAINDITVQPEQRLVMGIRGLPKRPAWQTWVNVSVGMVVLGLLGWAGIVLIGRRRAQAREEVDPDVIWERRRDELLDGVVNLEKNFRKGKMTSEAFQKARRELMAKLEAMYRADREGKPRYELLVQLGLIEQPPPAAARTVPHGGKSAKSSRGKGKGKSGKGRSRPQGPGKAKS